VSGLLGAARANVLLGPIGLGVAIVTVVVLARWLGPELYGEYAAILAMLSWVLLFSESGCNAGMQRYYLTAQEAGARYSLYRTLQLRRWIVVGLVTLLALAIGPVWAKWARLPAERWSPALIVLICVVGGLMLHAQLATSALLAGFGHRRTIIVSTGMTIVRACLLGIVCVFSRNPVALVGALAVASGLEAAILHALAARRFGLELAPLPSHLANVAQQHGLVGLVDKLGTQASGPAFIILVFSGPHGPAEIAMVAIATDLLQRALGVINLPLSNLFVPMMNEARDDEAMLVRQIDRFGGITIIVNMLAVGAIMAALPAGIPILFGEVYRPAVLIAFVWIGPLFLEAVARMVWGAALLQSREYKWLLFYNLFCGAVAAVTIVMISNADILVAVAIIGVLRTVFVAVLFLKSVNRRLVIADELVPWRLVTVAAVAVSLSLILQSLAADWSNIWRLFGGLAVYSALVLIALQWMSLIPDPSYKALLRLAGRYDYLVVRIIRRDESNQ
jgi:O-antigen/teichoic acid export membrane protein